MKTRLRLPRRQRGFSLIEGLVAILIFSLGVLALIGLQANSIQQSTAATYRSEATMLTNQLIGQMWTSNRTPATLMTNFQTGGPQYNLWVANVQAKLPGAATFPPTVVPTVVGGAFTGLFTITVQWKAPNEAPGAPAHQYVAIAQVQ